MRRVAILIALALGQPLDKFTNKWSFGKRDNDVLDNYLKENTFGWWSRKLAKMVSPDLALTMAADSHLTLSVIGPFGYTGDFDLVVDGCADLNFFKESVTICTDLNDNQLEMHATFHDGTPKTRIPKQTVIFSLIDGQLVQTISSPTSTDDLVISYNANDQRRGL